MKSKFEDTSVFFYILFKLKVVNYNTLFKNYWDRSLKKYTPSDWIKIKKHLRKIRQHLHNIKMLIKELIAL